MNARFQELRHWRIGEATSSGDLSAPGLSLLVKRKAQIGVDLSALVIAFALAYLLRFDFAVPQAQSEEFLLQLPIVLAIQLATLVGLGIYTLIWRYVGMREAKTFLHAAVIAFAVLVALRYGLPEQVQEFRVPFSIIVMDTILGYGFLLGMRILRRSLYERYEKRSSTPRFAAGKARPVLLVGAGRGGVLAAREILGRGDSGLSVVGVSFKKKSKRGSVIHGVPVFGTTEELPALARALSIDHVVITMANATRAEMRRLLAICETIPIKVRIVPDLYEILQGRLKVSRIRDVEVEDLLGREPVQLDECEVARFLTNRSVMITGAGGSIGSELARQVCRFSPERVLLVERAEFALFEIERELRDSRPELAVDALVGDAGNEERMRLLFALHRPQIVLHAAAHKHVPMMEYCPAEAVRNNVLATNTLGKLAGEMGAEAFVLISTDKAVRPRSVMGATKRMAEVVVQSLDKKYATRFVAVRFGNVIGSAGSVIPLFREQIQRGGPVKVTHPGMVRYFMTIPEASQLVLQASAIGAGGEIFVLDMGEPVNILDLAKETITLTGLRPFDDIDIVFTGIRPGEKLFEELEITEEALARTRHPKIFIGKIAEFPAAKVERGLERLAALARLGLDSELRRFLNSFLPEASLDVENPESQTPGVGSVAVVDETLLTQRAGQ